MGELADRIADLARIPSRVTKRVSEELPTIIQQDFDEGVDPYETPWEALAEATIARGRFPPPLTDTYEMRDALEVKPLRFAGVSITIGTPSHPAAPHQTGWKGPQGSGPARPMLPFGAMPPRWLDLFDSIIAKEFEDVRVK